MKKLTLTCLTASLLFTAGTVLADAEKSIEYRQSVFNVTKWHMDPLGGMAKGELAYDADAALHHARQVNAMSHMAEEGFAEGTEGGDAKADIWSNWDQFSGGMEKFQQVSAELVSAAEVGTLEALRPAVGEMGKTCKGCHDNFRD
jgi:cytochrome c556